jgi:hypothetical protein
MDCPLKYIGKTGRTFKTRYKEHIQAIINNNGNSGYSDHMLTYIQAHGRHHESFENGEEKKTSQHTGEVS